MRAYIWKYPVRPQLRAAFQRGLKVEPRERRQRCERRHDRPEEGQGDEIPATPPPAAGATRRPGRARGAGADAMPTFPVASARRLADCRLRNLRWSWSSTRRLACQVTEWSRLHAIDRTRFRKSAARDRAVDADSRARKRELGSALPGLRRLVFSSSRTETPAVASLAPSPLHPQCRMRHARMRNASPISLLAGRGRKS